MGLLQEGKWVDRWYDTKKEGGHFVRKEAQFRNWITADGASRQRRGAITFTYLWPAPGRIER